MYESRLRAEIFQRHKKRTHENAQTVSLLYDRENGFGLLAHVINVPVLLLLAVTRGRV